MASTTVGTRPDARAKQALPVAEPVSFLRRQGEIAGGIGLFGVSAFIGLALASWTVTDPSFSQSNHNEIANYAGASGAVVSDIAMQVFGLGAVLLAVLPAIWGIILVAGKPVDRIWRRAWFALAGIVLASAALGCLTAPAGWPLPIGLGGVAGDLVLKFPALATGAYPEGTLAMVLAAMIALPAGWLFLNGAAVIDRATPDPMLQANRQAATPLRAPERGRVAQPEAEPEEEGEGRFALLFGAIAHTAYSAKAAFDRRRSERSEARREPGEFADRFDDWQEEEGDYVPPAPPRETAPRQIRVTAPYESGGYIDPMDDEGDGLPRKDNPEPFQFDADAARGAPPQCAACRRTLRGRSLRGRAL